jgi:tetratricopeptide (TPR) repeat protein
VGEFQQAVKNPSKRLETQKYLGECFKRKRLFDLAVEQLKKASGGIPQMSALKKDILYELASVYEEMGKTAEAQREFEKIYTVDIAYKDVASKIER